MNDTTKRAARIGTERGASAAAWVTDGTTTPERYAELLRGIWDGDPAIEDALTSPELDNVHPDNYSARDLAEDLDVSPGSDSHRQACEAYEGAYIEAVSAEVERVALANLTPDSPPRHGDSPRPLPPGWSWQWCADGDDITGSHYAELNATEVRVWSPDATLVQRWTRPAPGWEWERDDTV